MTDFSTEKGTPITNLQTMLRLISQHYDNIPLIIPDGIFGEATTNAVKAFQEIYNLPVTGEVDLITFEEIVKINNRAEDERKPYKKVGIITDPAYIIYPGDSSPAVSVIKAMVKSVAEKFENINNVTEINNIHDEEFVVIIKQIQQIADIEQNGEINKKTFDIIAHLYEIYISL